MCGHSKRNVKDLNMRPFMISRPGANDLSSPDYDRPWQAKTKGVELTSGIDQRRTLKGFCLYRPDKGRAPRLCLSYVKMGCVDVSLKIQEKEAVKRSQMARGRLLALPSVGKSLNLSILQFLQL